MAQSFTLVCDSRHIIFVMESRSPTLGCSGWA